ETVYRTVHHARYTHTRIKQQLAQAQDRMARCNHACTLFSPPPAPPPSPFAPVRASLSSLTYRLASSRSITVPIIAVAALLSSRPLATSTGTLLLADWVVRWNERLGWSRAAVVNWLRAASMWRGERGEGDGGGW